MPTQSFIRSVVSARASRIALAVLLIALGLWAFAPFAAYRVSSSAFINSEVMRITAPIPGYLSAELPHKGQYIAEPEQLTLIKSYAADRQRLLEMEGQQAAAKDRAEFARKQLAEIAALDAELEQRMQAYRDGMLARISQEIAEADAEKTGCFAEMSHRRDIGSKLQGLADTGATSQIKSAEALARQEETMTRCKMASARLERLKAELGAMKNGVFLRDSANDVPYTQQQRERLFLRRQDLEREVNENGTRATQLAADIGEERSRVEHLGKYDVTLPADTVVWSVSASPGSVVVQGQAVLDLTDCKNRFVAVQLPEREFESIKPGDPASVRLIGSGERREGLVRRVMGSAARGDDRLFAAQVPVATSGNVTVEVSLPPDKAPDDKNYCDIGRLAEVRFPRKAPAFVENLGKLFQPILAVFTPVVNVAEN
ncbi:HlyD family efflux transporter periplasmic adaptor subunit [Hyphomicrobium sp.]|uniref:HlyD family secretion protein n=1 Tax=Hyphomicrobium sp. TaxID=82 RepID=UPI0025BD2388|nr:HlyD family efflux transporter periplasmic adaptor subunit [Hyphomicrobium sp.]MCC7252962.1 HlyD family efflux transporter periplasmic adaptor subunit [Hyphomicrobium sp.]